MLKFHCVSSFLNAFFFKKKKIYKAYVGNEEFKSGTTLASVLVQRQREY